MDSVDDQTGSVMILKKAVHIVDIVARFLSAYIGYTFNRNLGELSENGTEVLRTNLLTAIPFKSMKSKSMKPIGTEQAIGVPGDGR